MTAPSSPPLSAESDDAAPGCETSGAPSVQSDVPPPAIGPDTATEERAALMRSLEKLARELVGDVPEPFIQPRGWYIDTTEQRPNPEDVDD